MANILVTAIGSNSGKTVIESLRAEGHRIVGVNMYPREWIIEAAMVDKFVQVSSATSDNYIDELISICKDESIEYLIALTDVEIDVINGSRDRFNNIVLCMSSNKTIEICRNKRVCADRLKREAVCKTIPEYVQGETSLPIIGKPVDGRSSNGKKLINDIREYQVYKEMYPDYLFQQFISGYIYTVDVVRKEHECVAVPRCEILRTQTGLGITVDVLDDSKLIDISYKIADCLDILGCVNFEFIKDSKDDYYFMECNPRFSGGVEFSKMCGYDFVRNHLACFMGEKIERQPKINAATIVKSYSYFITR